MAERTDTQNVLLHEIHHRVKNNLQIIAGLLFSEKDEVKDKTSRQYLEKSLSRINSMAVVHEMLYEEKSLNALTIKEFFDRLVSVSGCFASGNGSRIIAETIGSLQIGIDTAVPFALIVNEFILWSIENLKGMKGKIRISFIPGENNDYILKTTDDGPEEKPVADLSKTLTEALAKQINGRIIGPGEGGSGLSLCFSPEGACSDTEKFYSGETDRNSGTTASE